MAELTSSQQDALLSRGGKEGESGEFKVVQDKVEDLVFNVKTLEDLKTSKVEVANAVVDAASVIVQQVLELLKWITKLEDAPSSIAPPSARSPGIFLSTMLIDGEGTEVMSIGDLMFKCTTLGNEIEAMRTEIWAQGGIVFGTHRFASEDALMRLIMKLHLRENGLAAFSDASSSFCHDEELGTLTDPHKMLSRLGVPSGVDRNYMLSFGQRYPQKLWELQNFLRRGQVVGVAINGKVAWIQYLGRELQKIIKTL